MITYLRRRLSQHLLALTLAISALALTATLTTVISVFSLFSARDAENIISRASVLLAKPMAENNAPELRAMGLTVLGNPSVYSIQAYSFNRNRHMIPLYGRVDHAPSNASWYTTAMMPLLSPLFYHQYSRPIEMGDDRTGNLILHFKDYERAEAALTLSFFIFLLTFFIGGTLVLGSFLWRKDYYKLTALIHKEVCADKLLDGNRFYSLRHHPHLQSLHSLVRSKKKETMALRHEISHKNKHIAMYESMMSKAQHENDLRHARNTYPFPQNNEEIGHLIPLIQHLSESIKDSRHQATAELIYTSLVTHTSSSHWAISQHGEMEISYLISTLHQISCQRQDPSIFLMPHIHGTSCFQGNINDVMKASLALIHLAENNNHPRGHIEFNLNKHQENNQLVLACHLSAPIARNDGHYVSEISNRKSFVSFKRQMEAGYAQVEVVQLSSKSLDIQVTLPLLPTKAPRNNTRGNLSNKGIFIVDNGLRASSLHHSYCQIGEDLPLVTQGQLSYLSDGIGILINEEGHCDMSAAEEMNNYGHKVIVISDAQSMGLCPARNAVAYIDLHSPLLYHLEQIALTTSDNAPVPLFGDKHHPFEAETSLGRMANLLDSIETIVTVWIPLTLSPLARASLATPLSESNFTVREYNALDKNPLSTQNFDIVFVDSSVIDQGLPPVALGSDPSYIMILRSSERYPDSEVLADIKHVVSLPIDTGYLTSIVQRISHLR